MENRDLIDVLGSNVVEYILSFLPLKKRIQFERVSKRWTKACRRCWYHVPTFRAEILQIENKSNTKEVPICHFESVWTRCSGYLKNLELKQVYSKEQERIVNVLADKPAKKLQKITVDITLCSSESFLTLMRFLKESAPENMKEVHISGYLKHREPQSEVLLAEYLRRCTSLECLDISKCPKSKLVLQSIPESVQRLRLDLEWWIDATGWTDEVLRRPRLRSLDLAYSSRTHPLDFTPLACATNLEVFSLVVHAECRSLELMADLPIRHLRLTWDEDMFPPLFLRARTSRIRRTLKQLSLTGNVGTESQKSVAFFGELERLRLAACKHFGEEAFADIVSNCPHLKSLDFVSSPGVNDRSLELIGEHCKRLEHLSLYYCRSVSDWGLKRLIEARFPPNEPNTERPLLTINARGTLIKDHVCHPRVRVMTDDKQELKRK